MLPPFSNIEDRIEKRLFYVSDHKKMLLCHCLTVLAHVIV